MNNKEVSTTMLQLGASLTLAIQNATSDWQTIHTTYAVFALHYQLQFHISDFYTLFCLSNNVF